VHPCKQSFFHITVGFDGVIGIPGHKVGGAAMGLLSKRSFLWSELADLLLLHDLLVKIRGWRLNLNNNCLLCGKGPAYIL
jgi:hypothetical protein